MLFAWPHSTLHCQTQQKQAQILGSLQCFYLLYPYAGFYVVSSFFFFFVVSFFLSLCLSFFLSSSFRSFFLSFFICVIFPVFFFLYSSCLLILYLCVSFLLLFPFNPCIIHTFNKPQRLPKTRHTKQLLSGRNFSTFRIPMLFAWPHSTLHCQTQQKQAQILGSLQCFYLLYPYAGFYVVSSFFFLLFSFSSSSSFSSSLFMFIFYSYFSFQPMQNSYIQQTSAPA